LKKVGETYRAAKEFELISDATESAVPGRLVAAFRAPDRFRIEAADPNDDKADGSFGKIVIVGDRSSEWTYRPSENMYASIAGDRNLRRDFDEMADLEIGRFRTAGDAAPRAKMLREETIEIGGEKIVCFVVTLPVSMPQEGTSPHTWWIEKKSSHVVREEHAGGKVVFTTIKINEPLPDDLFRFVPPPGARKTIGIL
jgi:outer membrane lipoprotein-sorting protein